MISDMNMSHPSYRTERAREAISRVGVELVNLANASALDIPSLRRLENAAKAANQALVAEDHRQGRKDNDPSPDRSRMAAIRQQSNFAARACEFTIEHELPPTILLEAIRSFAESCRDGDATKMASAIYAVARVKSSDAMVVLRRHLQSMAAAELVNWHSVREAIRHASKACSSLRDEVEFDPQRQPGTAPDTLDTLALSEVLRLLDDAKKLIVRQPGAATTDKGFVHECLDKVSIKTPAGRCMCDNTDSMIKALYGTLPGAP